MLRPKPVSRDVALKPGQLEWTNITKTGELFEKDPQFFTSVFSSAAMGLTPEEAEELLEKERKASEVEWRSKLVVDKPNCDACVHALARWVLAARPARHCRDHRGAPTAHGLSYASGVLIAGGRPRVWFQLFPGDDAQASASTGAQRKHAEDKAQPSSVLHPGQVRQEGLLCCEAGALHLVCLAPLSVLCCHAIVVCVIDYRPYSLAPHRTAPHSLPPQAPIAMLSNEPYDDPRDFTLDLKKNEPEHNVTAAPGSTQTASDFNRLAGLSRMKSGLPSLRAPELAVFSASCLSVCLSVCRSVGLSSSFCPAESPGWSWPVVCAAAAAAACRRSDHEGAAGGGAGAAGCRVTAADTGDGRRHRAHPRRGALGVCLQRENDSQLMRSKRKHASHNSTTTFISCGMPTWFRLHTLQPFASSTAYGAAIVPSTMPVTQSSSIRLWTLGL
eukprot:COSAG01_NODE_402_length_17510_cov_6.871575_18_plen_444_part_00